VPGQIWRAKWRYAQSYGVSSDKVFGGYHPHNWPSSRLRYVKEPFDNPDYIFELKHDGFRAVVYLQNGECKIVSRNQRNLGFESLKKWCGNIARPS
jgi:hypothetical protein